MWFLGIDRYIKEYSRRDTPVRQIEPRTGPIAEQFGIAGGNRR
jgi:hypothetical protein